MDITSARHRVTNCRSCIVAVNPSHKTLYICLQEKIKLEYVMNVVYNRQDVHGPRVVWQLLDVFPRLKTASSGRPQLSARLSMTED